MECCEGGGRAEKDSVMMVDGGKPLVRARMRIARWSLQKAQERIQMTRARRENRDPEARQKYINLLRQLRGLTCCQ